MAIFKLQNNNQANEPISKFKLLTAYGAAGSIIHTQYGSVIVSCIEEWGFLKKILEIRNEAIQNGRDEEQIKNYVIEQCRLNRNGNIEISNDERFLLKLKERKKVNNLEYLVIIPEIEIKEPSNSIKEHIDLAIPSVFMPKNFSDKANHIQSYNNWYKEWKRINKSLTYSENMFFPPKKNWIITKDGEIKKYNIENAEELKQDNIVLICKHGHISDFPWSKYLKWKFDNPHANHNEFINLFFNPNCCNNPDISITSSTSNASGFDGKWLKCKNCGMQISLKGLFNFEVHCAGHKPWEANTGDPKYYNGDQTIREQAPPTETCNESMKVALTTGNNLYFSRIMSSIYLPKELTKTDDELHLIELETKFEEAKNQNDFEKCITLKKEINDLEEQLSQNNQLEEIKDSIKEIQFRFQEYDAFCHKDIQLINTDLKHLKVEDVTLSLIYGDINFSDYFGRILRIDNMKVTSAQLDFSRLQPIDADSENTDVQPKNIFRGTPDSILAYPVVENYGEGIFFSFNHQKLDDFFNENKEVLSNWQAQLPKAIKGDFQEQAVKFAQTGSWQLYLVHTFSHLIMRELEFSCGYPTASLNERIYVSNDDKYKMYGTLIYTAEGAEGSMGGLIAQTSPENLTNLLRKALIRATVCHSDPLCWESEGQGLFDLNFASCFSCSLVSETSCEYRNIYLDRRLLVDEDFGFFKNKVY